LAGRCNLPDAHVDLLVQLLERRLNLIEPGSVIDPEQPVDLLPVPPELAAELGARHAGLAQRGRHHCAWRAGPSWEQDI
jgi:hypothetical protein